MPGATRKTVATRCWPRPSRPAPGCWLYPASHQPVADRGRKPEQCRAGPRHPDLRPRTSDDEERALDLIKTAASAIAAEAMKIEIHGGSAGRPGRRLRCRSVVRARQASRLRSRPEHRLAAFRVIAACGVPVVDTMGVRGGKIHSMEEYLIADSLTERAALSALTILRLAGESA